MFRGVYTGGLGGEGSEKNVDSCAKYRHETKAATLFSGLNYSVCTFFNVGN